MTSIVQELYIKFNHLRSHHYCALCTEPTLQRLCTNCQGFLYSTINLNCCYYCGLPLTSCNDTLNSKRPSICGECLSQPPSFDHTVSAYIYQAPLSYLLARFKYQRQLSMGKLLSELLRHGIEQYYQQQQLELPDMITAVPLYWKKQWQRGFNQSVFFSEQLSQMLHLPIFTQLKCTREVVEQKQLSRKQRLKNLHNSFAADEDQIVGKHIAIIDDVMTTGATVNSVAHVLKRAGAKQVSIWVLARTPQW